MAWSSEHAPFITRAALASAAAADNELAIDCGVLLSEALEIAGVLRRHVAHTRLAVADRRLAISLAGPKPARMLAS